MVADSAIRTHDKDPDGAIHSCHACFAIGRSIGDEPFMISQLVRIGMGIDILKATRRVLAQAEPSDLALATIQALVLEEFDQPLVLYGLRGERAMFIEIIRRIGAGKLSLDELGKDSFNPSAPRDVVTPWAKLWYDHQEDIALQWMNDAIRIEHRLYADRTPQWAKWAMRLEIKERTLRFWLTLLPLKLFPGVQAAAYLAARYRADLGATAILLAAERHRRKTGDWPESILSIDKSVLPTPPADPFSGQPFRMERPRGEIVIYSIGGNRIAEHGAHENKDDGADDVAARAWDVSLRAQPAPKPDSPATPSESLTAP
jgi:hypothetical protein